MRYNEPAGTPRVGLITLVLRLPGCRSLKEKRSIIRPLLSHLAEDNLSVAEVGFADRRDFAVISCVAVSSSWGASQKRLERAAGIAANTFGVDLMEEETERLI